MNIQKKILISFICVMLLCLIGYLYNQHAEKVKAEEQLAIKNQHIIQLARKAVSSLYQNNKKDSLAEDLTMEKIENALKQVQKMKDNKEKTTLINDINNVDYIFRTQNMINSLLKDGVLIDNVKETTITSMNHEVLVAKRINKEIASKMIVEAEKINLQYNTIKTARTKVLALFENGKLNDNVTRNQYNSVKKMVNTIQNRKAKIELISRLNKVDRELTLKEQAKHEVVEAKTKIEKQNSSSIEKTVSNKSKTESELASIVAKSPTAQHTDQIITVVANGTKANICLLEKAGGVWKEVINASGHVGSMGVGKASEYVSRTPMGSYHLGFAFGTSNPGTKLPFRKITPKSYWISNVKDPQYNTWQERSSSSSADEHLADYPVQYHYAIVINYNNGPGGGSGFFLHCDNGAPTAGCVSVPTNVMVQFMKRIHSGACIVNATSQSDLADF